MNRRVSQTTISQWHVEILSGSEMILEKKIERCILQGDSLSPLLFVPCMGPLSRKTELKVSIDRRESRQPVPYYEPSSIY
jgi:hypothetical protein